MKSAKTDLLRLLQKAFSKSLKKTSGTPAKQDESRRKFIKGSLLGAGAIVGSSVLANTRFLDRFPDLPKDIKIGILGGGVAGLHAAYILKNAKLKATIYEASKRSGGRMYTAKDLLGKGITTELGGEFVDSIHEDILMLAKKFKLPLIDTKKDSKLKKQTFYFGGKKYDFNDLVKALAPYVKSIKADIDSLPENISYKNFGNADKWDHMSIESYLDEKGITGWLKQLLDVAFTTEYGLDIKEQSSLNMLTLFDPALPDKDLFGESDERYKIEGGNQRVVDELAKRVDKIELEHEVVEIENEGDGFLVSFSNGKKLSFDHLICTIPFTKLRTIKLSLNEISEVKKKCIAELGYGMNAKMFAGYTTRYWRKQGASGQIMTDMPFQLGWDNSQLQKGTAGGYTFYTGGVMTDKMIDQPVEKKVLEYIDQLDKVFPGAAKNYNGKNGIFYWPTHPHTMASYACYKPGQWTTIRGAESEPIGNMLFAGEHCSADYQGYMNGGAETGRVAAETLIKMIKRKK